METSTTEVPRTPPPPPPPLDFIVQTTTPNRSLKTLNSSAEATRSQIHRMLKSYQDAVNGRRFWPSEPGWCYIAPNFAFKSLDDIQMLGSDNHLEYMENWCAAFPRVSMLLYNLNMDLDEAAGKATTLADLEVRGMPVGTVRHFVQTLD